VGVSCAARISALGICNLLAYRSPVIGFLRFAGILNAAVWLGAAVYFIDAARPAVSSAKIKELLGAINYPYFSDAITRLLALRLYYLELVCAFAALVLVVAEWLYFGKTVAKWWRGLLVLLLSLAVLECALQPKLEQWQRIRYGANTRPEQREKASTSFSTWQRVSNLANLLLVAGVAAYLWRVANPPDPTRFVSRSRFRC